VERVEMTLDEYRRVRADESHFFTVPGHELPWVEGVVRREPSYAVVEKQLLPE
jgi:hypothetical protein